MGWRYRIVQSCVFAQEHRHHIVFIYTFRLVNSHLTRTILKYFINITRTLDGPLASFLTTNSIVCQRKRLSMSKYDYVSAII